MAKRIGGSRRKTRHKLQKSSRGISLTKYFQEFKTGERVGLAAEPSVQKGMYHPRFYGKTGVIKEKVGRCYEVSINDLGKNKVLIVHPIHLKKV